MKLKVLCWGYIQDEYGGAHGAVLEDKERNLYIGTSDGIAYNIAGIEVNEDDNIEISEDMLEGISDYAINNEDGENIISINLESKRKELEDVYVVVFNIHTQQKVEACLFIENCKEVVTQEMLEKAGYDNFGEFGIAWANHYITKLSKADERLIDAYSQNNDIERIDFSELK